MTAILLCVLAQAPADVPVALVISSRRDTSGAAAALVEQLKTALAAQQISAMGEAESVDRLKKLGGVDPKACDGARLCLQKLAQLLQGVVVGVDVSKAGKLTAGHLEALSFDRVDSLAADDVSSDAKAWNQKAAEAAAAFAGKLREPLAAINSARKGSATPPKVANNELKSAPVLEEPKPTLVPEPPPTPVVAAVVDAKKSSGVGPVPYIAGGVGIVSLGVGIALMALGFIDRGTYFSSRRQVPGTMDQASTFTDRELSNLASRSNAFIAVGGALMGLAGALGITSAVLFLNE